MEYTHVGGNSQTQREQRKETATPNVRHTAKTVSRLNRRYRLHYDWAALISSAALVPLQFLLSYCWGGFQAFYQGGRLRNFIQLSGRFRSILTMLTILFLLFSVTMALLDMRESKINKVNVAAVIVALIDIPITQLFL